MHETVSVCMSETSLQISNDFWELYCLEHGIDIDGQMATDKTWFNVSGTSKHVPRAVLVNLEPAIVNGMHHQFLFAKQAPTNTEGASDCDTLGKEVLDLVLHRLRKLVDQCTGLHGFLIFHSFGGGTGTDLTSLLMDRLSTDYGKKSAAVVEPYKTILAAYDDRDCTFMIGDDVLYDFCKESIHYTTCVNLNRLLGQIVSFITASMELSVSM